MANIKWTSFPLVGVAGTTSTLVGLSAGANVRLSLSATPSASGVALWDANVNFSANNFIDGYASTATAAGLTTLTVASPYYQVFTGSTTQTVLFPVTSTLALGQSWLIVNKSSGNVSVTSSGGNIIQVVGANNSVLVVCISLAGTTAASWVSNYFISSGGVSSITGTANQVVASASTGNITLSLPQSIATTSNPTFNTLTLTDTTVNSAALTLNNNSTQANQVSYGLIANNLSGGTGATRYGVQTNVTANDLGVGSLYGFQANVLTNRTSGGTFTNFAGAWNAVTTGSGASGASNLSYYGSRNTAVSQYTGETVTIYGCYGGATGASASATVYALQGVASGIGPATIGLYAQATGASTINYGVYATASGATTNWGVYSNAGTNYFRSNVSIGNTTPTNPLTVTGAGSFTGQVSATSFAPSSTSGIIGTTTNDDAATGSVGQLISSVILVGSAVSLTTATASNITSISLTAGDWDVWGSIWTAPSAGTITTKIQGGIGLTTGALPSTPASGASYNVLTGFTSAATEVVVLSVPDTRVSLASTTTIYLVASVAFSVSTLKGYGNIYARRRR